MVSLVSLVSFVLVACRRGPEASSIRIAIGGQNQLIYLPTTLAQELGFYRDEGLTIELQDLAGGSKALEALLGGSADVVSGFYDHTIQMAADGRELVAFVTMLRFPGLVLVTSPQAADSLRSIADLRGRVAGVTTAGSSSQMLLTSMLRKNGVSPDAVSITAIGSAATAIAAIEHGKVDAGMMADPAFALVARRNPTVRVLADLRTAEGVKAALGLTAYPASVLYSKGEWVRSHRDAAAGLARAIRRTLEWMATQTPQQIADRTPATFRGEDAAVYTEALKGSLTMFSPDGVMPADGPEGVRRLLSESMEKVRQATIDLSRTYTNEFVSR